MSRPDLRQIEESLLADIDAQSRQRMNVLRTRALKAEPNTTWTVIVRRSDGVALCAFSGERVRNAFGTDEYEQYVIRDCPSRGEAMSRGEMKFRGANQA